MGKCFWMCFLESASVCFQISIKSYSNKCSCVVLVRRGGRIFQLNSDLARRRAIEGRKVL